MKKLILMAVAATLTLNLVACAGGTKNQVNPTPDTSQSQDKDKETVSIQAYMGQVKGKVGNDLTVSLGKLIIENGGGDSQAMMIDENGNQVPVEGDFDMDSASATIMIPMPDDAGAEDGEQTTGAGEIEKLPIEFTGEVREFTIPAGVKILNGVGKEVTLDAVTKGSLVQLIINESTGVVESLMVF